jgi:hypothetical protein
MKRSYLFGILLVFCINAKAQNLFSCKNFYTYIDSSHKVLTELKSAFKPLSSEKFMYLNNLREVDMKNFSASNVDAYKKAVTKYYNDIDQPQYEIEITIDRLLDQLAFLRKSNWENDKNLLDKVANQSLKKSEWYLRSPYQTIQKYYSVGEEMHELKKNFSKFSQNWIGTNTAISVEAIKVFENSSNAFFNVSAVGHCHLYYLEKQTLSNLSN